MTDRIEPAPCDDAIGKSVSELAKPYFTSPPYDGGEINELGVKKPRVKKEKKDKKLFEGVSAVDNSFVRHLLDEIYKNVPFNLLQPVSEQMHRIHPRSVGQLSAMDDLLHTNISKVAELQPDSIPEPEALPPPPEEPAEIYDAYDLLAPLPKEATAVAIAQAEDYASKAGEFASSDYPFFCKPICYFDKRPAILFISGTVKCNDGNLWEHTVCVKLPGQSTWQGVFKKSPFVLKDYCQAPAVYVRDGAEEGTRAFAKIIRYEEGTMLQVYMRLADGEFKKERVRTFRVKCGALVEVD